MNTKATIEYVNVAMKLEGSKAFGDVSIKFDSGAVINQTIEYCTIDANDEHATAEILNVLADATGRYVLVEKYDGSDGIIDIEWRTRNVEDDEGENMTYLSRVLELRVRGVELFTRQIVASDSDQSAIERLADALPEFRAPLVKA